MKDFKIIYIQTLPLILLRNLNQDQRLTIEVEKEKLKLESLPTGITNKLLYLQKTIKQAITLEEVIHNLHKSDFKKIK